MLLEPDRFRHTPITAPERTEAPKVQGHVAKRSEQPPERDKGQAESARPHER